MYKVIVFAVSSCFFSCMVYSQESNIASILQKIEENNKDLVSYASLKKSMQLELKSRNNLPDPFVGGYYMPWGTHDGGTYTEIEISQTFEFPTVYGARSELIESQNEQLVFEYSMKRQAILLEAKKYCQDVIYLNKRIALEQNRMQQAKRVYDQTQELYVSEQVGILDVNKAKLIWLRDQFRIDEFENEKENTLLLLQNLNGGIEVSVEVSEFSDRLSLTEKDSLWAEKLGEDPRLLALNHQEEIAYQQIRLSKATALPNITAGYNYQGVKDFNYSGLYAGVSIPIWNNKNKVKAKEAQYEYRRSFTQTRSLEASAVFDKRYNEYLLVLKKFSEFRSTLKGLNSENLLFEAYELGEFSYMEYFIELQFYRQAHNTMLEMEKQLHQLKAELLQHQL